MENYVALLLLVVPGFISRRIYGLLNSQRSTKSSFEETIYSLIFSVFNIFGIYIVAYIIAAICDNSQIINKETIMGIFNNPQFIAFYAFLALISSILVAIVWKIIQPLYMGIINYFRKGKDEKEVIISGSVFNDTFDKDEARFVELYREDKMIARGILSKMHQEEGEFYLEDAEPEIDFFIGDDGKIIGYKGHYIDIKNNLIIREIDTSKHKK